MICKNCGEDYNINANDAEFHECGSCYPTHYNKSNLLEKLVSQPSELLPCPFCGGEGQYFCWDKPEGECYDIVCEDCPARSPIYKTMEEAKNFWNKRASQAAPQAMPNLKVTFIAIDKEKNESVWDLDAQKIGISTSIQDPKTGLTLTNIKFEEKESVPAETLVRQGEVQPVLRTEIEEKYNELIMAVAKKFTNETRHETALRYINEAESFQDNSCSKNESGQSA